MTTQQCRTCGKDFKETEMFDTDYRTFVQQGDPNEMVCEGCYDNFYGKCRLCGAIREETDLVKDVNGDWICNIEQIEHQETI